MTRCVRSLISIFAIFISGSVLAAKINHQLIHPDNILQGGSAHAAKTAVDTLLLIGPHGSGAVHNGQFETVHGLPNWQGWTSVDLTRDDDLGWNVSTYHASGLNGHGEGNKALWCGDMSYASCGELDEEGGYGNRWHKIVDWYGAVADPEQSCNVAIEAWLNYDLEMGYDYLYLRAIKADDSTVILADFNGHDINYHLQNQISYSADDYVGENADQVHLQFVVITDDGWSDEDCIYGTVGACQVDDITVILDNGGLVSTSDFEDGTLGDWELGEAPFVGDFAKLWNSLGDIDPCQGNRSPQVAFIDDGLVVPGTGGTQCIDWCYGPGGYIVNHSGGLAGDDYHLNNMAVSPVLDISSVSTNGYLLEYDMYHHEDFSLTSAGVFAFFKVRSTSSDDAADIELAPWIDNNVLLLLPGVYRRQAWDISEKVVENAQYMQVSVGAWELGFIWGIDGENGTPGPYFDNIRVAAFASGGPLITTSSDDLSQDSFPANGHLNLDNLGSNNVRFDMARGINNNGVPRSSPGDSIVCEIVSVRSDAEFSGLPQLHYRLQENPVFDDFRTSGLPAVGVVDGWPLLNSNGDNLENKYAFDLPDEGFLYPGDILHYFISATDEVQGVQMTSTMPADTTGFSQMNNPLAYHSVFTVRALPNVAHNGSEAYQKSDILFWNDGGNSGQIQWNSALINNGLFVGENCDEFFTSGAFSGHGGGLGFNATVEQITDYSVILYTSGSVPFGTLTDADAQLLDKWLTLGEKSLLAVGDHLASDLSFESEITGQLLIDYFGVQYVGLLEPRIQGQRTPKVVPADPWLDSWIVNGGCPNIKAFDAVVTLDHATSVASFADASGGPNYEYSAMTRCETNSSVISMPYSLDTIINNIDTGSNSMGISSRSMVLRYVLDLFGVVGLMPASTPDALSLQAGNHPNPFNPSTIIEYVLPKAEHLSVKVYDVRGKLVSTLVDEQRSAGAGQVVWSGANDQGGQVSSGVYFYKLTAGGETLVRKMSLIK